MAASGEVYSYDWRELLDFLMRSAGGVAVANDSSAMEEAMGLGGGMTREDWANIKATRNYVEHIHCRAAAHLCNSRVRMSNIGTPL
eukprot:15405672-Alexandrium_andersonii.AAC.1